MHSTAQKENQSADNAGPAAVSVTRIQPKLSIGAVNDPLEHEADAMADKVMGMQAIPFVPAGSAGGIQRKCAGCEEEEQVQCKSLASFIQRKESPAGTVTSDTVANKINASKGSGSSMDSNTGSFMQSRFGADFNNVKIHTGGEAIQMNRELGAKAFTVGNDIYFNKGQYNPGSADGKHLLAHELTHTVQQGNDKSSLQKTTLIQKQPAPVRKRNLWLHVGFDSSARANETTMRRIRDSIAVLKTSVNHCCTADGNGCGIRVRTLYDWNRVNKPAPTDGDYDGDVAADSTLRDTNIANINTGRAGGIRMLVTGSTLSQSWQGERITARANTDPTNDNIIWNVNIAPADTLAHETGHVAEYSGGDIEGNDHSSDPDNLMSRGNIRNAGALPDANWCQQVDALSV